MKRYYFDLREDGAFLPDNTGAVFPTVDAAASEAAAAAMAIAQDRLPTTTLQTVVVEARDEHGARVVSATVSLKVKLCCVRTRPTP